MDFNQTRYFLALSETLNFTHAAELCCVSQPALTQAIRRLEEELGGELIVRKGRETTLTSLGQALHAHFEQLERTRNMIKLTSKEILKGDSADLNIGIMCTIGPRILSGMLDDVQKAYPMNSILLHDVTPDVISDMLLSGELDGAFCARHADPEEGFTYTDLFEEPMVVAFSKYHDFNDLTEVPLSSIAAERYVDRLKCEFREEFIDFCMDEAIQLNVVYSSQREDWIQSMIRDGVGVTVIPRFSLLHPELKYKSIKSPKLSRRVEFVTVDKPHTNPGLGQLISHIEKVDWSGLSKGI